MSVLELEKPTLAVDYDDVQVESGLHMLSLYNRDNETDLGPEYVNTVDSAKKLWGAPNPDEAKKRINAIRRSDEFLDLPPMPDAVWGLGQLAVHYRLILLTGRPREIVEATRERVGLYLPNVFSEVLFTEQYPHVKGGHTTKGQICEDYGVDALIEDLPHYALEVAGRGIPVLLFGDYPWNRDVKLLPNMRRAKDWNEVVRALV